MNNAQNQNGKKLEEISYAVKTSFAKNPYAVKTTLRGLHNFQNGLPNFGNSWKTSHYFSSIAEERVLQMDY